MIKPSEYLLKGNDISFFMYLPMDTDAQKGDSHSDFTDSNSRLLNQIDIMTITNDGKF